MSRMISASFYLTPEQREALAETSKRTRVPIAVIVRLGVDLALAEWAKEEGKAAR